MRRRLIVALGIVVVALAVWAAIGFFRRVAELPREAYAVWWAADLVIACLERHDGAWPRSWEDLQDLADGASEVTESAERGGSIIVEFRPKASIEELKRLVEIDWDADPNELRRMPRKDGAPPFRVIYLRNGKSTHYEGREPNQMILEYLKSKHRVKEKQAPS
jgi:hypothetical protein